MSVLVFDTEEAPLSLVVDRPREILVFDPEVARTAVQELDTPDFLIFDTQTTELEQEISPVDFILIDAPKAPMAVVAPDAHDFLVLTSQGVRGPAGPEGPQGPVGPAGSSTAALSYTHHQDVSDTVWDINHTLAFIPSVTTIDSAGTVVVGDVEYVSAGHIRVSFAFPFGGTAYLS